MLLHLLHALCMCEGFLAANALLSFVFIAVQKWRTSIVSTFLKHLLNKELVNRNLADLSITIENNTTTLKIGKLLREESGNNRFVKCSSLSLPALSWTLFIICYAITVKGIKTTHMRSVCFLLFHLEQNICAQRLRFKRLRMIKICDKCQFDQLNVVARPPRESNRLEILSSSLVRQQHFPLLHFLLLLQVDEFNKINCKKINFELPTDNEGFWGKTSLRRICMSKNCTETMILLIHQNTNKQTKRKQCKADPFEVIVHNNIEMRQNSSLMIEKCMHQDCKTFCTSIVFTCANFICGLLCKKK